MRTQAIGCASKTLANRSGKTSNSNSAGVIRYSCGWSGCLSLAAIGLVLLSKLGAALADVVGKGNFYAAGFVRLSAYF